MEGRTCILVSSNMYSSYLFTRMNNQQSWFVTSRESGVESITVHTGLKSASGHSSCIATELHTDWLWQIMHLLLEQSLMLTRLRLPQQLSKSSRRSCGTFSGDEDQGLPCTLCRMMIDQSLKLMQLSCKLALQYKE